MSADLTFNAQVEYVDRVGHFDPLELVEEPQEPRAWSRRVVDRLLSLSSLVILGDVAALVLALAIARPPVEAALVVLAGLVTALAASQLYRSRLSLSVLDDFPRLALGWLVATALVLAWQAVGGLSPRTGLTLMVALGLTLITGRLLTYSIAQHLRRSGVVAHRSLVIGANDDGQRIARILGEHPEYGLRPIGFLADRREQRSALPLPIVGRVGDLARTIEERHVNVAILASQDMPAHELVKLVRSCHRLRCELFLIPLYAELHSVSGNNEVIWGVPLVRLKRAAHRTVSWRFKRLVDIAAAVTALVLLAPILSLLALAVRLEGGPGIIFRQTRIGIDGQQFSLLKFRSMRPADPNESATNWNISHDDRLGPVGRFIRKTSLDELPQLFNIARGDMSLVGPRPERPHFVERFNALYPNYEARDRVPCGLTGWAQIHGLRGDTSIDERAEFDNFYIENWSLWLDLKITLRTVTAVITRPGS